MVAANVKEEYLQALRAGQKESRELLAAGLEPYPAVLDEILPDLSSRSIQTLPVQEIPIEQIVGTKTAGRTSAFSAGFYPLLEAESEFAMKWMSLCQAQLSDVGIRDPILCYEYLGSFYVQEGNKRVSVLKHFGAARISASVKRILPVADGDPRITAYYEFLDFYRDCRLYDVQFRRPGDYAKLLSHLGKTPGTPWTEEERRRFSSRFHLFREAYAEVRGKEAGPLPEEALLLWLQVYPADALGDMTAKELKTSLTGLRDDLLAGAGQEAVSLHTLPDSESKGLLDKIISPSPSHLRIAMIHQRDSLSSSWAFAHEQGAQQLQAAFPDAVTLRSYYHADTPEQAAALLDEAVADGAELVFTTTPQLLRSTLKAAVKYPKVRFLNCSADTPLTSVRSYYCRTYEGKFITGAIAGALAENDLIGYIGSYPILGVPASINAFALGAQLTNPRAKILLEWSCLPGEAAQTFLRQGVRVISNRDIPVQDQQYMEHGRYGTFLAEADGTLVSLASPCWLWGNLYENIVRSILSGSWKEKKGSPEAVNYWWGMDSGVIDVELTDCVPEGLQALARQLMQDLREGRLDPFRRRIAAQDGSVKNDGTQSFTPLEILRMDWLCDNVQGCIPAYDALLPASRGLVRELGVYRETIPPEKEGAF